MITKNESMKLISMTDFVLERENMIKQTEQEMSNDLYVLSQYAHFLKQSLTLEMFVPCDESGNVLEEPNEYANWIRAIEINEFNYFADGWDGCRQYHEAKEKVLFVFDFNNPQHLMESHSTIEDLANFYSPLLTKSAIKQIGL